MQRRTGISILARAPVPGHAKTRLIPALGAAGAAALQGWFLRRSVAMAVIADIGPVSLWCGGDRDHPDFGLCRAYGPVSLREQAEGDLGRRMLTALQQSPIAAANLIIGTDCPALSPASLRQAARALDDYDAVVIPAEDGGYVLIGMRIPAPEIFAGIDWGSERVMAQTRACFAALGWRWQELPTLWDVDRPEDLSRLQALAPDAPLSLEPAAAGS